jgi:leader peptidase (prepilin peptidase)/N-methyltransferase
VAAVLAALAGLPVGALAAAVSARVPPGQPRLGRWWIAVVLATAALFAAFTGRFGVVPALPALLALCALAVALAVVDVRTHRLPDALTLPAYPLLGTLLVAASLVGDGALAALGRAVAGALGAFAGYYLLAALGRGALGFGDVKLAGVLGMVLGWAGWASLAAGVLLGFVFGGMTALLLLAARRVTRRTRVPFGPFMLAGALAALALGDAAAARWLGVG